MENCQGLFGEEEKFDSSIFETGIVDYLEAFGIVFNLVRIFIFCTFRSACFSFYFCKSMHFK